MNKLRAERQHTSRPNAIRRLGEHNYANETIERHSDTTFAVDVRVYGVYSIELVHLTVCKSIVSQGSRSEKAIYAYKV